LSPGFTTVCTALADEFRVHLRERGDVRSIQFDRVAVIVEVLDRIRLESSGMLP
jgi:hypothetical protein